VIQAADATAAYPDYLIPVIVMFMPTSRWGRSDSQNPRVEITNPARILVESCNACIPGVKIFLSGKGGLFGCLHKKSAN